MFATAPIANRHRVPPSLSCTLPGAPRKASDETSPDPSACVRGGEKSQRGCAKGKWQILCVAVSAPLSLSDDEQMTTKEVAGLLKRSEWTLIDWRRRKLGPPAYRLVGRIVYYRGEVEEWRRSSRWG